MARKVRNQREAGLLKSRQDSSGPTQTYICGLIYHSSTIAQNTLYFDGGFWNRDGNYSPLEDLISIDLTKPFTTKNATFTITPRNTFVAPDFHWGSLFTSSDEKHLIKYGGYAGGLGSADIAVAPDVAAYKYDIAAREWTVLALNSSSTAPISREAQGVAGQSGSTAYILGGAISSQTDPAYQNTNWTLPVTGILNLNLDLGAGADTESVQVRNDTTNYEGISSKSTTLTGGTMVFNPNIGEAGAMIVAGGSFEVPGIAQDNVVTPRTAFDEVSLFDIKNEIWYRQASSGDIPSPRWQYCTTTVSAPDNSSHEVFVYGGEDDQGLFNDLHVLTMPAFVWKKISNGTEQHNTMTCHVAGNRQMITVGGSGGNDAVTCSQGTTMSSLRVFDMTAFEWTNSFDPSAKLYLRNTQVYGITGGDANGNATVVKPGLGWDNPAIDLLFNKAVNVTGPASTTATATSIPTSTTTSLSTSKSSPPAVPGHISTPAIAGIVIGVILLLTIIAGLVFFIRRKNNRSRDIALHSNDWGKTELPAGDHEVRRSKYAVEMEAGSRNSRYAAEMEAAMPLPPVPPKHHSVYELPVERE